MSEDNTAPLDDASRSATAQEQDPKPDEIDWKAKARDWERKAKANADAARRLVEIEEASKSEAERAADRLAKAEQAAREAEARALRREIALEHKLTKDDAALLDAVTGEDAMRLLAARLGQQAEDRKKNTNHVPREGSNPAATSSSDATFARDLLGG